MTGQRSARLTHRGCLSESSQCGAAPFLPAESQSHGRESQTQPPAQAACTAPPVHRRGGSPSGRPAPPPGCTPTDTPEPGSRPLASVPMHTGPLSACHPAVPWSSLCAMCCAQLQGLMATCQSRLHARAQGNNRAQRCPCGRASGWKTGRNKK